MTALLTADRLVKHYGSGRSRVEALSGVDLRVEPSMAVAVCGPSGSGKSTLLHLLAALDTPTAGSVHFGSQALSSMTEGDRALLRRRRFGFVFQAYHLLPTLSAVENVALPLLLDGQSPSRARPRAQQVLELVDLAARGAARPGELSGGERQRVAVARALVGEPEVVFADEPTGNLDRATGDGIIDLLISVTAAVGRALVMVTHDSALAAKATRVVALVDGRIATAGAP